MLTERAQKMRVLDLFCGAGGASMGLHRAWPDAELVGVDIEPQPRYPFTFVQADALTYPLEGFDFIWASPPCQRWCGLATREDLSGYPDLIEPVRLRLIDEGKPFVIENVPGAPVRRDLMLCGAMFGLRTYRHRHFECSFPVTQPDHPKHLVRVNRRGENRREHWANGGFLTITGDVGTYCGPEAMGIDWMSGAEMSEAIPPAYSAFIAKQLKCLDYPTEDCIIDCDRQPGHCRLMVAATGRTEMESTYELPYDDRSHAMIESAIAALGGSKEARVIVGKVYALGRIDGHTESSIERSALLQKAIDKMKEAA